MRQRSPHRNDRARRRAAGPLAVAAAAALVLGACGSGSSSDEPAAADQGTADGEAPATASGGNGDGNGANQGDGGGSGKNGGGGGNAAQSGGGGAPQQPLQRNQGGSAPEDRASEELITGTADQSTGWQPPSGTGDIRVTYKGQGGSGERVYARHGGAQSLASRSGTMYIISGVPYSCSGTGESAVCVQAPAREGSLAPYADVSEALTANPDLAVSASSATVAGRSAVCPVVGDTPTGSAAPSLPPNSLYTVCFDQATGVLLSIRSDTDGPLLEASSAGPSRPADVRLPAEPLPLPGG